jgi:hypothetical protein
MEPPKARIPAFDFLAILHSRAQWGWRTMHGNVDGAIFKVHSDALWATQSDAEKSARGTVKFHAEPVLRIQGLGEITITEDELTALGPCPNL